MSKYLSIAQVAEELGVSKATAYRLAKEMERVRVGGQIRVTVAGVNDYLRRRTQGQEFEGQALELEYSLVYFVVCGDAVKIGWTSNIEQRMQRLQTANPRRLDVVHTEAGGKQREALLHDQFKESRIGRGEWFLLAGPVEQYIAIAKRAEEDS